MATSWYDPTGSNAGFYNSPEDFLFKSQSGTWYGQGPSGQKDAAKMPTMAEYYFGGPAGPSYYDRQSAQMAEPIRSVYGGPTSPEGYRAPAPARIGGGGNINLGNNVSVPQGPLWQRYQALQANPAMIEADPAFQYLKSTGEQALARSAGARRKRFSGETMLDFQRHAQGLAATNLRQLLPELRAGAQQEYGYAENEAQAKAQRTGVQALTQDPYGRARSAASQFSDPNAYASSVASKFGSRRPGDRAPFDWDALINEWMLGQRLNQMGA